MARALFVLILLSLAVVSPAGAQPADGSADADLKASVAHLESELSNLQAETRSQDREIRRLRSLVDKAEEAGAIMYFFGIFCALWAQNTKRSPWLWFFLGAFFNVITVLFLLSKNSEDIARRAEAARMDMAGGHPG